MLTVPTMRTSCTVPGGIHIPRCGGMTQVPCGVASTTTPRSAGDQLTPPVLVRRDDVAVGVVIADRDDRAEHVVHGLDLDLPDHGPLS